MTAYVDPPELQPAWRIRCETCGELADPDTRKIRHKATEPVPDMDTLGEWVMDSVCGTTDGCEAEPDGYCEHGHASWLLRLGLI